MTETKTNLPKVHLTCYFQERKKVIITQAKINDIEFHVSGHCCEEIIYNMIDLLEDLENDKVIDFTSKWELDKGNSQYALDRNRETPQDKFP